MVKIYGNPEKFRRFFDPLMRSRRRELNLEQEKQAEEVYYLKVAQIQSPLK
jgi:hypothetical protein